MALAEANPAAREATAAVAMVERAPYRRWDRARTRADFDSAAVPAVLHHHQARVARDAPRRFRGNARGESGLALWRTRDRPAQEHQPGAGASPARAPRGRAHALRPDRAPRATRATRRRSGSRCPSRRTRRTRG